MTEDLIPLPHSSDESEFESSDCDVGVSDSDKEPETDSDSEPECFSFSATQESRREAQQHAAQAIKLQKDELKRKRKEIVLQNFKQREEKRRKIESKKLPDHILENLDDEFEVNETDKSEDYPDETKEDKTDVEKELITTSGNITFKCKVHPIEVQKSRHIPEKVAHFKERLLYGNRIKREKSNRDAILKREKQCIKR